MVCVCCRLIIHGLCLMMIDDPWFVFAAGLCLMMIDDPWFVVDND